MKKLNNDSDASSPKTVSPRVPNCRLGDQMTDTNITAMPDGGTTSTANELATRGTTLRKHTLARTRKAKKAPARVLAQKDRQQLCDEFDYLAWTITCEVEWVAELLGLLLRPDRDLQSRPSVSANASRRIRRREDRLQLYVRVVHELGHFILPGGNPKAAQRSTDNAVKDVSMVPGEPHHD